VRSIEFCGPPRLTSVPAPASAGSDRDDPASAEPLLRECLDARRKVLPANHWLIANTKSVLGGCLTELGEFAEAEQLVLDGYETLKTIYGKKHWRAKKALGRVIRFFVAADREADAVHYRVFVSHPD
jgi:eukaryotic-like serine/threonine-protein kinase